MALHKITPALAASVVALLGLTVAAPPASGAETIAGLGVPSMIQLAGMITYALATGQGVYIRPVAQYPPVQLGYWR